MMRLCSTAVRRGGGGWGWNVGRRSSGATEVGGGAGAETGGGGEEAVVVGARRGEGGGWELTEAGRAMDSNGEMGRELAAMGALREGAAVAVRGGAVACLGSAGGAGEAMEGRDSQREAVREAVGAAVRLLTERGAPRVKVDGCGAPGAAAEGAVLAGWRFQQFKAGPERRPEPELTLLADGAGPGAAEQWREGSVRAKGQNWARWLSDMPANRLAPFELAQTALDVLCPLGVRCEARDLAWIRAHRMQLVQAVARGSCEPPFFLELAYDGPGAQTRPVLLVAKGVTFDSGGLCLKPPAQLTSCRGSVAGAAAVLGAFRALATMQAPLKLRAAIPLCENMVSGQCMKVGDVVPALNGLNVQIEDTDMEGRLLMADALVHGQAQHRPALVVTIGSLSQGAALATGGAAFAAFATSDTLWRQVAKAGGESGDRGWRLPLWQYYRRQLTNESAVDVRNRGSGHASACLGAAFLQHFVCGEWTHWDISGVCRPPDPPAPAYLAPQRMTGRPTRTLVHFLLSLSHPPDASGDCDDK